MSGITLKKLAELSGLSVRTVNRVLKNQGEVTAANRKIVTELAERYHYMPNIAARNFRLQKQNIVGILMSRRLLNESHLQKVADLERNLISAGFFPLLGCTADRDVLRILEEWIGTVKFVVSFHQPDDPDGQARFDRLPFEFIFIDRDAGTGHHTILLDRAIGIEEACNCLAERNCRRILHCGEAGLRTSAVDRCAEKLAGKAEIVRLLAPDSDLADGYACGPEIMKSRADAVFFDTDRMAAGFYRYAWENRIRIPNDLSVVGFDDDSASMLLAPPLSSVAHPIAEISSAVMEIIENDPGKPVRRILATRFIRRESVI